MSIDNSGLKCKLEKSVSISIKVDPKYPLIRLSNTLNWERLAEWVTPDLKRTTTKLKWWLGRKLKLRTHLGVYLLQQLLNETDRGIENAIRYNAAYQVFCGKTFMDRWSCPDHTKIEEFRSRLSSHTQYLLGNEIALFAARLNFAKPEHIDIDSTVQEPDMQYPALSNLVVKTAAIARKVQKLLEKKSQPSSSIEKTPLLDFKKIKALARDYFFIKQKKGEDTTKKDNALKKLWLGISEGVLPMIQQAYWLKEPFIFFTLKSREKQMVTQFTRKAKPFLSALHAKIFENNASLLKTLFSFHRDQVACFNKAKHHKSVEFGRQFQIGRLLGNFVWSMPNNSIRMPDADAVKPMIRAHQQCFQKTIQSVATDKGYYSKDNEQFLLDIGVQEVALHRPRRKLINAPSNPIAEERLQELINRRSGIEPIIGHLKKRWQMGRSRMKSDETTERSGYCAILGFNLQQMMRYLSGQVKPLTP